MTSFLQKPKNLIRKYQAAQIYEGVRSEEIEIEDCAEKF